MVSCDKSLFEASFYSERVCSFIYDPLVYGNYLIDFFEGGDIVNINTALKEFIKYIVEVILIEEIKCEDFDLLLSNNQEYLKKNKLIFPLEYMLAEKDLLDFSFADYINELEIEIDDVDVDYIADYAENYLNGNKISMFIEEISNHVYDSLITNPRFMESFEHAARKYSA